MHLNILAQDEGSSHIADANLDALFCVKPQEAFVWIVCGSESVFQRGNSLHNTYQFKHGFQGVSWFLSYLCPEDHESMWLIIVASYVCELAESSL